MSNKKYNSMILSRKKQCVEDISDIEYQIKISILSFFAEIPGVYVCTKWEWIQDFRKRGGGGGAK